MTPTTCYQTADDGRFIYEVDAYNFPNEERLNIPFRAVEVKPPEIPEGSLARWVTKLDPVIHKKFSTSGKWVLEEIPPPPAPAPAPAPAGEPPAVPGAGADTAAEDESPAQA